MADDLSDLHVDKTLKAVDEAIVLGANFEPRFYLGASKIGHQCDRHLWYEFRHTAKNSIDAQGLRNIADGNLGEDVMADRLKAVEAIELRTIDKDTGHQYAVIALGGHFRGHLDGALRGLHAAPKATHIWEHKQVNEKKYRDLDRKKEKLGEKNALEAWDETYFAQAQVYMGLMKGCNRHYMTVASPGGRQITSVRTNLQKDAFNIYMDKARHIVEAAEPPGRISSKGDFYICRWCQFNKHCHSTQTAEVNCRTCAHSTPTIEKGDVQGTWVCEFHNKKLSKTTQRKGCKKHLYIPDLIPWGQVKEMDQANNTITYRTNKGTEFVNAEENAWDQKPKHFASKDLQHIDDTNIDNDELFFEEVAKFKARIVENKKAKRPTDPEPFDDSIPF